MQSHSYKIGIKPVDTAFMMDTNFLGSLLLRDTKKLSAVVRRFADDNFLSFFAQFGIASGESGVPAVENQTVGDSLVRWRIIDNTVVNPKIVDDSRVPDVIYANEPFLIGLNSSWVDKGGIFLCEDMRHTLYVHKRTQSASAPFWYEVSVPSGVKRQPILRRDLFLNGRSLNYHSNARVEGSRESQAVHLNNSGYDMFNVTQVIRHKLTGTGHGISTMIAMEAYNNQGADKILDMEHSGFFPFNATPMLKQHLAACGSACVHERTNFDPIARKVYTIDPESARPEVPIMAGAMEQLQWTEFQEEYNPNAPISTLANHIDALIASRAEYFKDPDTIYLIVTQNGGEKVLNRIKEHKHKATVQVTQEMGSGNTVSRVGVNYKSAEYYTDMGTFKVLNIGYSAVKRGIVTEKVMYQGAQYDKSGFDMYVIPLRKNDDGRRTIRLCTKSANGVNRGLVLGSLAGMSGLYNGGTLDLKSISGKDFAASVSSMTPSDKMRIATATDGEEFLALSEITVIVECPDDILWIKAKF